MGDFKPLKIAGISGILSLVIMVLVFIFTAYMVISSFSSILSGEGVNQDAIPSFLRGNSLTNTGFILLLFGIIFELGLMLGFIDLAKRFNNRYLYISSRIIVFILALSFILSFYFYYTGNLFLDYEETVNDSVFKGVVRGEISETPIIGALFNLFGEERFWLIFVIFFASRLVLMVFFIIGIFQLNKKELEFAKIVGVFEAVTLFLNISFFTILFETIMFFKASKKYEYSKKENIIMK